MTQRTLRQRLYELGCRFSDVGADLSGHPLALIGVILFCGLFFALGGDGATAMLTLVLSVMAITLTQMVLNQQRRHEAALHLKIDELIHAIRGARDEVMGIEHKSEAELEALRIRGDEAERELEERRSERVVTTAK